MLLISEEFEINVETNHSKKLRQNPFFFVFEIPEIKLQLPFYIKSLIASLRFSN